MIIRDADISDAQELSEIYAPYVANTAVSFEFEPPAAEEFEKRIAIIKKKKYPYLVAEDEGKIVGYCYAGAFHSRKAYEKSVETSIYIRGGSKRQGIGRLLYAALEDRLRAMGIKNMYAAIAYSDGEDPYLNKDSVSFHEKMGFVRCGHFNKCGVKFGRQYDVIYMEKLLDDSK